MNIIASKMDCSGCCSCYNACPQHCIDMKCDEEGFRYPVIDLERCVNCGICKKVCPVIHEYKGNSLGTAYACINTDENAHINSSSGGVFSLIAQYILKKSGVVFGAAFDSNLNVHHIEIKSENEIFKLQGSKYLQSNIGDAYKSVKEYLKQDIPVLFTGTPCQISGLKSYLGKDYDNLITQDIICHGVPSPEIWQKYLKYMEALANENISREHLPQFRNKKFGWKCFAVSLCFTSGKHLIEDLKKNLYMKAFLNNLCLRHSCYNCHSKSLERQSDITLADFWGVESVCPEMFDANGTSLVLINSEKGQNLFEQLASKMRYQEVDIKAAAKYNTAAYKSCERNVNRDSFMKEITACNFNSIINKYTKQSLCKSFITKTKRIIKKLFAESEK